MGRVKPEGECEFLQCHEKAAVRVFKSPMTSWKKESRLLCEDHAEAYRTLWGNKIAPIEGTEDTEGVVMGRMTTGNVEIPNHGHMRGLSYYENECFWDAEGQRWLVRGSGVSNAKICTLPGHPWPGNDPVEDTEALLWD